VTAAALERVQGLVLRSADRLRLTRTAFYFLTLDEPDTVRRLVGRLLAEDRILSDAEARRCVRGGGIDCQVAVGFTAGGLERLGHAYHPHPTQVLRPDHADDFRRPGDTDKVVWQDDPDAFGWGMAARSELLGDRVATPWPGTGCNMLLWIATATENEACEEAVDRAVRDSGVHVNHFDRGAESSDPPIALGFRDGTGQPYLSELASSRDRLPGGGTITPDGWRPVPLGEFVLGYTDAGGERLVPEPRWLAAGGTFLVYRKYEFNVAALDQLLADEGHEYERAVGRSADGVADVAAKLVGRYRVGETPAELPEGYDATVPPASPGLTAPAGANDFRYGHDTYGHACPLGAHIRRANPRDALGFDGELTERHRILRRSVLWEEEGREGLHFVCVNARINDQFEFIQRRWFNTGSAFRLGADIDLIAGSWPEPDEHGRREAGSVIQGTHPVLFRAQDPLTELQGGDYFLMPGMDGLRALSRIDS
jgi:deferrochelatase/peroxidase EfeB